VGGSNIDCENESEKNIDHKETIRKETTSLQEQDASFCRLPVDSESFLVSSAVTESWADSKEFKNKIK